MVEANPHANDILKEINVPYEIVALSNEEKTLDFYVEKSNWLSKGASFYKEVSEFYEEGKYDVYQIPTKTLDSRNYFEGEKIDLIKIDVQGSEYDIILGGQKTLERTEYVIMELSLIEYNENAPGKKMVIEKMAELDFYIADFLEYTYTKTNDSCMIIQIDVLFKKIKKLI